eukprot:comp22013_c0_seq1/m.50592 comp22013_c0_seq1/g.50592  ORF comp22013_c0_seq1/g.50592 comp22013_c0_seq1/m.50592 type:complete len:310 (-) comp22013_c0_seq1:290-1219(-)
MARDPSCSELFLQIRERSHVEACGGLRDIELAMRLAVEGHGIAFELRLKRLERTQELHGIDEAQSSIGGHPQRVALAGGKVFCGVARHKKHASHPAHVHVDALHDFKPGRIPDTDTSVVGAREHIPERVHQCAHPARVSAEPAHKAAAEIPDANCGVAARGPHMVAHTQQGKHWAVVHAELGHLRAIGDVPNHNVAGESRLAANHGHGAQRIALAFLVDPGTASTPHGVSDSEQNPDLEPRGRSHVAQKLARARVPNGHAATVPGPHLPADLQDAREPLELLRGAELADPAPRAGVPYAHKRASVGPCA